MKQGVVIKENKRAFKRLVFVIVLLFCVIMSGCASKPVLITEYKEIKVPIKCQVKMPNKPNFDPLDIESAGKKAEYFIQIEELLKGCIGE